MNVRKFVEIVNSAPSSQIERIVDDDTVLAFKALPYIRGERRRIVARVLMSKLSRMSAMELMMFIASLPPKIDVVRRLKIVCVYFRQQNF
ncbi:MAG: hypothetical protein QXY99_01690 [Thermoproteota archaeon]